VRLYENVSCPRTKLYYNDAIIPWFGQTRNSRVKYLLMKRLSNDYFCISFFWTQLPTICGSDLRRLEASLSWITKRRLWRSCWPDHISRVCLVRGFLLEKGLFLWGTAKKAPDLSGRKWKQPGAIGVRSSKLARPDYRLLLDTWVTDSDQRVQSIRAKTALNIASDCFWSMVRNYRLCKLFVNRRRWYLLVATWVAACIEFS